MCAGMGRADVTRTTTPTQTLRAWARDIRKWRRQRRTVLVYFDNDQKSAVPQDARRLIALIERR
jgi:uncharacterized protein YecE (DUF72 family)